MENPADAPLNELVTEPPIEESILDGHLPCADAAEIADAPDEEAVETAESGKAKLRPPRAVLNILAERYPAAFHADGRRVKPLAVGVLQELRAARQGENPLPVSVHELRRALRYYTQGAAYLRALLRGEARINLQGEAVGEVTEEQKQHAQALWEALEPKLPKRPPRPQRAAQEAAEDGASTEGKSKRPRRGARHGEPRDGEAKRGARRERNEAARGESRPPRPQRPRRHEPTPQVVEESSPTAAPAEGDKLSQLLAKFAK